MRITSIVISDDLIVYLEKRNLGNQYKKVKSYILQGNFQQVRLKLREPKHLGVYYFRINKQYRALCYVSDHELRVFDYR